jgi:hypothetical protein
MLKQNYDAKRQRLYRKTEKGRKSNAAAARRWTQSIKIWLRKFKDRPCSICGKKFHHSAMDFHHRRGEIKLFTIGNKAKGKKILLNEISKCDIICSNCHRVKSWKQSLKQNKLWTKKEKTKASKRSFKSWKNPRIRKARVIAIRRAICKKHS